MAVRSILVPVDFSPSSNLAARLGVAIARRLDTGVKLIHAVDLHPPFEIEPEVMQRYGDALMARSVDAMAHLVDRLDAGDLELSDHVVRGKVGPTLREAATVPPASLAIIGSSGRDTEPLHLGSVAAGLIREAPCPVLVVRTSQGPRLPEDGAFTRPMVAVDHSRFSAPAVRYASILARPGATLELFHALFVPRFEQFPSGEVDKLFAGAFELAAEHERERLTALAALAEVDNPVEPVIEMGRAAELIDARLAASDVDLLVTGAHGRETSTDLLVGTVADRLLRSSPVPVLFIPDAAVGWPD